MSEAQKSDTYFEQAGSWADDQLRSVKSSRRTAWIVAGVAALIALAESIALVTLTPLKTVTPYTLLVDRQTGYVQALNPIAQDKLSPDTALTQSFLVQYVIAREGYDFSTVQSDFRKVMLWSSDEARSDYQRLMQVSNPDSPLVRLPKTSALVTQIRSISSVGKDSALVRFETQRRDRGGSPQIPQSWVAILNYRYTDTAMSADERFINPLGFQIVRYRRSAEAPPMAADGVATQQSSSSTVSPNSVSANTLQGSGSTPPSSANNPIRSIQP